MHSISLDTTAESAPSGLERLTLPALVYLFVWFVVAVVAATTAFIALSGTSVGQWFAVLGIMLEYFYIWAAVGLAIYFIQRRSAERKSPIVLQALVHVSLLAIVLSAMPFLIHQENWATWLYGQRAAAFHALGVFIYAALLAGCKLLDYYRLLRDREARLFTAEIRRAELERSLESSRMDVLRAQINPHFLFNALNSLAALIDSSANDQAYEVVERLAALLRSALDHSRDQVIALGDELEFLDAYLAIESIRFGKRFSIVQSVPEACLAYRVPSFSLQPLVENVVKHGVSLTNETVTVHIAAKVSDDMLHLSVSDDGPGLPDDYEPGIGIASIEQRISHLFGDGASLSIGNSPGGGTLVVLSVPLQVTARPDTRAPGARFAVTGSDPC